MGLDNPVTLLILILPAFLLYFLPSILGKNKQAFGWILLINIFLGWTFIGWIVALIWALSADPQPMMFYNNIPNPTPVVPAKTDELMKFKQLLDSGAITQEEYDKEKSRILSR